MKSDRKAGAMTGNQLKEIRKALGVNQIEFAGLVDDHWGIRRASERPSNPSKNFNTDDKNRILDITPKLPCSMKYYHQLNFHQD